MKNGRDVTPLLPVADCVMLADAQAVLEYRAAIYRSIAKPLRAARTLDHVRQVIERLERSALADECRAAYYEYRRDV